MNRRRYRVGYVSTYLVPSDHVAKEKKLEEVDDDAELKAALKETALKEIRAAIYERLEAIGDLVGKEKDRNVLLDVYSNLDRDVQSFFCECFFSESQFRNGGIPPHEKGCLYKKLSR